MSVYEVGKRVIASFALLAACIAVSSLETSCDAGTGVQGGGSGGAPQRDVASGSPDAGSDSWFEGAWSGQVRTGEGSLVSVNLAVTPLKSGEVCATMIYGGSRGCTVRGRFEGRDGGRLIFSLMSQNGGVFCDRLDTLTIWKSGSGTISYSVTSGKGRRGEEGVLTRSGDNSVTRLPADACRCSARA